MASAGTAFAQSVAGTLLRADSTPGAGVIVVATSGAGDSVLARTLTGSSGRFKLDLTPGTVRLRALRIGQRPFVIGTFALAAGETRTVRTVLPSQPILLQAMVTTGSTSCMKTGVQGEAIAAVFEEARKALLSTQLRSDEQRPVVRFSTWTQHRSLGDRETSPKEMRFQEGESLQPFNSLSPDSLARVGYVEYARGENTYWAPDADVLLSDTFAATHCLDLTEGTGAETGWIGLGFRPAVLTRELVDVRGTLWIDRRTSELRRMDFGYEGLAAAAQRVHPGGRVEFTRLPDGLWFVNRWEIRMPRVAAGGLGPRVAGVFVTGGEVWRMKRGEELLFTNGAVEPAAATHVVVEGPTGMVGGVIDTIMTVSQCEPGKKGAVTPMVHGVVHDEDGTPMRDALVTVEWQQDHWFDGPDVLWQVRRITGVTAPDGYFTMCGIPREQMMSVRAQYGALLSGKVIVRLREEETRAWVDVRFPSASDTLRTKGVVVRVRDIGGRGVPHALVEIEGGRGRVTDDSGRVLLSAAPDSLKMAVRRMGYSPFFGKLGRDAATGEFAVLLPPRAQVLGAVRVTVQNNVPLQNTGFYDRVLRTQRGAFNGDFITPEELDAHPVMRVSDLFTGRRFVSVSRAPGGRPMAILLGRAGCRSSVFLDGRMISPSDESGQTPTESKTAYVLIDDVVDPHSVAAIEIYASAANAPAELIPLVGAAQQGACGIVAIWTGSRR